MSTSITGARFEPGTDAFTAACAIRNRLSRVALRYDLAALLVEAVREVDDADVRGAERPADPVARALKDHLADRRNDETPHLGRCHVWLGTDPDDTTGRVVVAINAPTEFTDALTAIPGVTEYSYTNASDWLPDGVTRDDYQARKAAWGRILPSGMPKRDMLAVEVRDPYDTDLRQAVRDRTRLVEDLAPLSPALAERAHNVAFALLWQAAKDTGADPFVGRLFFGQPVRVRRAVAGALDPDLPRHLVLDTLDDCPAPDLSEPRALAAQWVADGMPEDPIDEDEPDTARNPAAVTTSQA